MSPHDALGSNLIVQTKHDVVKRVLPFENEEINECWLSDKDRFSYEALNSDERLSAPMIKQGGEWLGRSTGRAHSEFVATGCVELRRITVVRRLGCWRPRTPRLKELYLLQKLARGLESENVDFRLRQVDFRADGKRAGAPWLGMPIAGVKDLNRLLVIGSFLRKDAPCLRSGCARRPRRDCRSARSARMPRTGCCRSSIARLSPPRPWFPTLAQVLAALVAEKAMSHPLRWRECCPSTSKMRRVPLR